MCGGEPNIRIEKAGNGFVIDSYSPGGRDKPGEHKRSVATHPEHALRVIKKHLGGKGMKSKESKRGSKRK